MQMNKRYILNTLLIRTLLTVDAFSKHGAPKVLLLTLQDINSRDFP